MKYLFIFLLLFVLPSSIKAELRITEIMQSNVSSLFDEELGDFPDSWVELYNDGKDAINLNDYALGIKEKYSKAFQLPDHLVEANQFILVSCDKVGIGLHTDFRLESDKKGTVYLFKNKNVIESIEHPAFPAPDISYGMVDGSWGYLLTSTPGEKNIGDIVNKDKILGNPIFSQNGCLFPTFDSITISLPDGSPEDTEIRYTLDGSMPTKNSNKLHPEETIGLNAGTTIIRARLFKDGWLSPLAVSQSYINHNRDVNMPVISIVSDNNYFFDDKNGILVDKNRDTEWRRPINFEYFSLESASSDINQICETRVGGGSSRKRQLKSMMVYANKRFGTKHFNYAFFPEQKPQINKFKSIYLRNAGNDYFETYIRDAVAQLTMGMSVDLDWQAVQPTLIYLNGKYHGILNLRERSNEDYVWSNYDGLEDIVMVENFNELKAGDFEEFEKLMSFIEEGSHTREEYNNLIDIKEIMDAHLLNLFFNNTDFPGNNMILWRPMMEGGVWRIIVKDVDYAMGIKSAGWDPQLPPSFDIVKWFNTYNYSGGGNNWGNLPQATLLFRRLIDVPEIKENFLERCYIYMGDFLNEETVLNYIDYLDAQISPEWSNHEDLYLKDNIWGTRETNISWIKEWIQQRRPLFCNMLTEFYSFGQLGKLRIVVENADVSTLIKDNIKIYFNNELLRTGKFDGLWPKERNITISLEGLEQDCLWCIETDKSISEQFGNTITSKMTSDGDMTIRLKLMDDKYTYIQDEIYNNNVIEYYDLQGNRILDINQLSPGIYIKKSINKVEKLYIK